ncbi:MAG: Gfo/Idh/MocA family oxidoreductase [Bacteroidales bacterium]
MSNAIKTGLASYGMSSIVFHGPLLKVNPNFTITHIVERNNKNSKNAFPEAQILKNFDELCRVKDLELIIVNTPDPLHYSFAKKALEAGKHVVVEKPFTQSYKQAEELIEIAKKKGVTLSVFQNRRWDGDFLTVRKVIENKMLGRLVEFESHFDRYRNFIQEDTWKESSDSGAGTLYNLGSHMIDQALVLFGMPKAVYADIRINRSNGEVDDSFDVNFKYNDLKVITRGSYLVREPGPRYILHGTEGSFLKWGIDPQEQALKEGFLPEGNDWGKENPIEWGKINTNIDSLHVEGRIETIAGNYGVFYENIFDTIRNGSELYVKPEEAAAVIRIIEAAKQSNESGKEIKIN